MKNIVFFALFIFCSPLFAERLTDVRITKLMIDKNHTGKVFLTVDKPNADNANGCRDASSIWSFTMSYADEMDKAMYSTLLSAYMADRSLNLVSSGNCLLHSGVETLTRIELN